MRGVMRRGTGGSSARWGLHGNHRREDRARPTACATRGSSATRRISVVGVWVGADDARSIGLAGFGHRAADLGRRHGEGRSAEASPSPFTPPPGIVMTPVDSATGLRACGGEESISEAFRQGSEPAECESLADAPRHPRRRGLVCAGSFAEALAGDRSTAADTGGMSRPCQSCSRAASHRPPPILSALVVVSSILAPAFGAFISRRRFCPRPSPRSAGSRSTRGPRPPTRSARSSERRQLGRRAQGGHAAWRLPGSRRVRRRRGDLRHGAEHAGGRRGSRRARPRQRRADRVGAQPGPRALSRNPVAAHAHRDLMRVGDPRARRTRRRRCPRRARALARGVLGDGADRPRGRRSSTWSILPRSEKHDTRATRVPLRAARAHLPERALRRLDRELPRDHRARGASSPARSRPWR